MWQLLHVWGIPHRGFSFGFLLFPEGIFLTLTPTKWWPLQRRSVSLTVIQFSPWQLMQGLEQLVLFVHKENPSAVGEGRIIPALREEEMSSSVSLPSGAEREYRRSLGGQAPSNRSIEQSISILEAVKWLRTCQTTPWVHDKTVKLWIDQDNQDYSNWDSGVWSVISSVFRGDH